MVEVPLPPDAKAGDEVIAEVHHRIARAADVQVSRQLRRMFPDAPAGQFGPVDDGTPDHCTCPAFLLSTDFGGIGHDNPHHLVWCQAHSRAALWHAQMARACFATATAMRVVHSSLVRQRRQLALEAEAVGQETP